MNPKFRWATASAALLLAVAGILGEAGAQEAPRISGSGEAGPAAVMPPATGTEHRQEPPTLTLGALLTMVRESSPRLRAARLQVDATRTRESQAGLLPDPMLMVGVSNLALPELSATMPASMAPMVQATQQFPLAGKLALQEEMARQTTRIQEASAENTWWMVRSEAAAAFYELYSIEGRAAALRRTLGLLRDFETVALARYSAGTGPQADVLRANVARAKVEANLQRLSAFRAGSAARLNGVLARPSGTPVPSPELGALPAALPPADTLVAWALEGRPTIQAFRISVDRADSNRALAEKAIWPDLTLGLQYGLGRMDGDSKSMGGASLGFSLPVYAGRRQRKLKEEAAAMADMARAELDDATAMVAAQIGGLLADAQRARTLMRLYQDDILPQARAAVQSSLSSYRVGAVDFMALVDAQMAVNDFEGEYVELLAAYGTALAQLEQAVGREIPAGDDVISETR